MADEPSTPANDGANADAQAPAGSDSRTFTQEQVDQLIEQRLNRVRAQFKGHDELKAKAERFDALENERRSEAEKLVAALEKANRSAQEAQEREKAATERAHSTLIRAAVVSEAAKQRAVDPDAVYALLDKSKLTIGDGDQVDGASVADAVKGLLDERSYLLPANGPRPGFDGGARDTAPASTTAADFNAQLRREAGFA
jgi:hypothetical protein